MKQCLAVLVGAYNAQDAHRRLTEIIDSAAQYAPVDERFAQAPFPYVSRSGDTLWSASVIVTVPDGVTAADLGATRLFTVADGAA